MAKEQGGKDIYSDKRNKDELVSEGKYLLIFQITFLERNLEASEKKLAKLQNVK